MSSPNIVRIFSGIQPTGRLHLGNYLGAVVNWARLQNQYVSQPKQATEGNQALFCVVDMHSITTKTVEPDDLRNQVFDAAAVMLASGIDPKKSIIFQQSKVSAHAELSWIFSCLAPMGWLKRMTQFMEKSKTQGGSDQASVGLFSYPVLMAADILLYKSTHVPVGEDQTQHMHLARDIAHAFNHHYKQEYFPMPEMLLTETKRVMSLRNGKVKMSKSDPSEASRIHLTDDAPTIRSKIMRAKSDSEASVWLDPENRPEVSNLLTIYAYLAGKSVADTAKLFEGRQTSQLKAELADLVVASLDPFRVEYDRLIKDPQFVRSVLADGADRANEIAHRNMTQVKRIIGYD